MQLKLKRAHNINMHVRKIIDTKRLKEPDHEVKQKFNIELRNRFNASEDLYPTDQNNIEQQWENIKMMY